MIVGLMVIVPNIYWGLSELMGIPLKQYEEMRDSNTVQLLITLSK